MKNITEHNFAIIATFARELARNLRTKPFPVEVVGRAGTGTTEQVRRRRTNKKERDSVSDYRRDANSRVVHEVNERHRAGRGSYSAIIQAMMTDPVWAARMKHRTVTTWKREALRHKRK